MNIEISDIQFTTQIEYEYTNARNRTIEAITVTLLLETTRSSRGPGRREVSTSWTTRKKSGRGTKRWRSSPAACAR